MSAQPVPQYKQKYTIEEYIELLKNSAERFEYFDGDIVSMASDKINHGAITANVIRALGSLIGERPCQIFSGNTALRTTLAPPFRLPDLSVVCGQPQIEELQGIECLLNPLLICEVLSPATQNYDREEKFLVYQALASFQEYLLVEQSRPHLTHYARQADGRWLRTDVIGIESTVYLESLDLALPLNEVYRRIIFPEVTSVQPTKETAKENE